MMKLKTLAIMIAATTAAFTACTENDSQLQQMMPITLTSQIATTRSFTPTQENHLVSGQKLYVWANREATEGTANWTQNAYLKAWTLTADGSGALTGSTKYYPPQTLSMVALHGNFSFTEDTDVFPGTVQHSVLTDQSTEENYAKSDLLYWKALGQSAEASKAVTLGHKLSKIEIHLSGNGYTDDDIDQMELTLNNVLPTASLDLTDGTLSQAYGTAVSIKPYKTNKVDYEAIIPPQQKPLDFITVTLNGTVVKIDAQVTGFDENTRYPYNLDMTCRDVRKNPLWYVAEYNVNYDGSSTYSWATTPDEGYFFSWADAMTAFTTLSNASAATPTTINNYYLGTGCKFSGWHLPVKSEWYGIVPGTNTTPITSYDSGSGTYKTSDQTVMFGYNDETRAGISEASYWVKSSSTEVHALRYLGTEYCSAWKYTWDNNMVTISATLIGNVTNSESEAKNWYETYWNKVYFGNNDPIGAVQRHFYACGYRPSGSGNSSSGVSNYNSLGRYQCATQQNEGYTYCLAFDDFTPNTGTHGDKTYGRNVRLFRNNGGFDIRRNPLWYMAEYNLNSTLTFDTTSSTSQGYIWKWPSIMNKGYTPSSSSCDGYAIPSTPKTVSNGEAGVTWHIPTEMEWKSIVPSNDTGTNIFTSQFASGLHTEPACVFGYNDDTKYGAGNTSNPSPLAGTQFKSYWSSFSTGLRYAIRFLGTDYCSVWRYQILGSGTSTRLVINAQLINNINDDDISALSSMLTTIMSNDFEWSGDESKGAVQRTMYACGYTAGSENPAPGVTHNGITGYYWSSTQVDASNTWGMGFASTTLVVANTCGKDNARILRLFRDN